MLTPPVEPDHQAHVHAGPTHTQREGHHPMQCSAWANATPAIHMQSLHSGYTQVGSLFVPTTCAETPGAHALVKRGQPLGLVPLERWAALVAPRHGTHGMHPQQAARAFETSRMLFPGNPGVARAHNVLSHKHGTDGRERAHLPTRHDATWVVRL